MPVANLVRHIQSGNYYARIRVRGKLIWKSLKTDRISVAKLRLGDFHKEKRQRAAAQTAVARVKNDFCRRLANLPRAVKRRPITQRAEQDLPAGTNCGLAEIVARPQSNGCCPNLQG